MVTFWAFKFWKIQKRSIIPKHFSHLSLALICFTFSDSQNFWTMILIFSVSFFFSLILHLSFFLWVWRGLICFYQHYNLFSFLWYRIVIILNSTSKNFFFSRWLLILIRNFNYTKSNKNRISCIDTKKNTHTQKYIKCYSFLI